MLTVSRIRTVKPEFFNSDDVASVSLTAERTFLGLFTQADDRGRHRDNARIIYGTLWITRTEQTPEGVEDDLRHLAERNLVCRYTGCDGKRYLHIVTWDKHQKISHPAASRLPACPEHQVAQECGGCKQKHCTGPAPENFRRPTENRPLSADTPTGATPQVLIRAEEHRSVEERPAVPETDKTTGQSLSLEPLRSPREKLVPGSRIKDPGSTPNGDGFAAPLAPSADRLVAQYVKLCARRPASKTLARLGKETKDLLADGFTPDEIWAGLLRYHANPKSPALLPDMVNEALNGTAGAQGTTRGAPRHQAWTNPTADAYAEEL
ncbi:hypothetical protein ABH937_005439 [Kitasatospora sp. GAS1066B]